MINRVILLMLFFNTSCSSTNDDKGNLVFQKDSIAIKESDTFRTIFNKLASDSIVSDFQLFQNAGKTYCSFKDAIDNEIESCSTKKYKLLNDSSLNKLFIRFYMESNEVDFYCVGNYLNIKCFLVPDLGYLLLDFTNGTIMFIQPPPCDYVGISDRSIGAVYFLNENLLPYASIKKYCTDPNMYTEQYYYERTSTNDFYGCSNFLKKENFDQIKYSELIQLSIELKNVKALNENSIFLENRGYFRKFPLWLESEMMFSFKKVK